MLRKIAVLILAGVLIWAAAACQTGDDVRIKQPTPTSTKSTPQYPPASYNEEIAESLDGPSYTAARFAIETDILENRIRRDTSLIPQLNERLTYAHRESPYSAYNPPPITGGELFKAIRSEQQSSNTWLVTFCVYDTPGEYRTDQPQLELADPKKLYYGYHATITSTTDEDGNGARATTPRLLKSSESPGPDSDCEPLQPDPFVRQPPEPLPPANK